MTERPYSGFVSKTEKPEEFRFMKAVPPPNEYPVRPVSWLCQITEVVLLLSDEPVNDVDLPLKCRA
jgi:hypothetical protein